jgi:predicted DCC family thiol-disulfide oxidoreductase YuxK
VSATAPRAASVVLFDGVCNLCNGSVDFLLRREKSGRLRFASLQSDVAKRLLAEHRKADDLSSIVLIEDGRVFTRSDAALRLLAHLRAPWPLFGALRLVPRPLRDLVYDQVARHRYSWFGRRSSCRVPTAEERARFLDAP